MRQVREKNQMGARQEILRQLQSSLPLMRRILS